MERKSESYTNLSPESLQAIIAENEFCGGHFYMALNREGFRSLVTLLREAAMTDPDGAVTADSADYANKLYGSIAAARGVDLV